MATGSICLQGFLVTGDKEMAHGLFSQALECFKKAQAEVIFFSFAVLKGIEFD